MKKLINKAEDVVKEELEGVVVAHPDLVKVHFNPNFVVRVDAPVRGKVGLLSGGRLGPRAYARRLRRPGHVGCGLSRAVFTSPTPDQMLEATKAINGGAGVLHIVKNYTGDIMNFEMAADLARAESIEIESV